MYRFGGRKARYCHLRCGTETVHLLLGGCRRISRNLCAKYVQHINAALADAVAEFPASQAIRLETYARRRISGNILDGLRGADPPSHDVRRKDRQVQKVYQGFEVKRSPR